MSYSKIIKIRYLLNGGWKEEVYESDDYDQLNGVLEHLANRYAIPLIEAKERGAKRQVSPYRNLVEYGITEVEFKFEDSDWRAFNERDLLNV